MARVFTCFIRRSSKRRYATNLAKDGRKAASPRCQGCVPGDGSTNTDNQAIINQDDHGAPHTQTGQAEGHSHTGQNLPEVFFARCRKSGPHVSQSFLWSWRHHPNLILSRETLGLGVHAYGETASTAVRKLILRLVPYCGAKDRDNVDKWLEKAVTQGIEELTLTLLMSNHRKYEFPHKLLWNGLGDSLHYLYLSSCSMKELRLEASLTKLELLMVRITGDELCCLLSSSSALQQIPYHLQRLTHMKVGDCSKLRVIESKAPNLSSTIQVSLGGALQVKNLHMNSTEFGCYTQAKLASSMPSREMINSPTRSSKLANLNSVAISFEEIPFARNFDCSSLASIFGAALTLEALISHVSNELMHHVLIFGDPLWMLGNKGVWSPKNKRLVQLACHMLMAWLS
ncbi:hypothetical protein VPH35_033063 [Triticum aestivum]